MWHLLRTHTCYTTCRALTRQVVVADRTESITVAGHAAGYNGEILVVREVGNNAVPRPRGPSSSPPGAKAPERVFLPATLEEQ